MICELVVTVSGMKCFFVESVHLKSPVFKYLDFSFNINFTDNV